LDILNEIRRKGLNPLKETHKRKTYQTHIRECHKLVEKIIKEIYNYSPDLVRFALILCDLHDIGKLLPKWEISLKKRPFHAVEGAEWFLRENIKLELSPIYYEILAYAIMTHHSPLLIPDKLREVIKRAERISHVKRYFAKYFECRKLSNKINKLLAKLDKQARFDLADIMGIVKMADIMSAKGIPITNVLMQYLWLEKLEDQVERGILKRAYEKRGSFDHYKFKKQVTIASHEGEHILIAAPTGWGKTALALVRIIFKKPVKVFYILPTITAIRDLYETLTKIVDRTYVGEYFYFADVELLKKRYNEEIYPFDIYRYFIPKITLTTIDQLLLTVLQVGKYYTRRFNLKRSLLIFDEFHSLTPQMIAGIRIFLKNLSEPYNLSCLFMSATPSPIYTSLLKEVLPRLKAVMLNNEYKRLMRHKIVDATDQLVEEFVEEKKSLLQRKRTLILVNTVSEAQRLYKILKESLNSSRKITLIHGDFAYKDRMKKEARINSTEILISTQVAEVSLDISFDLLITELAPIPSLVQRFGRVNRYGGVPSETNIYICKPKNDKPYGPILINLARENLSTLINGLELKGEAIYLTDDLWKHERLYVEDIRKIEEDLSERIDCFMYNFFSFLADEKEILEMLGREEKWLAIPEIYLKSALSLFEKFKNASNYQERMKIYAQIKENLVSASRSDIRRAKWNDELKLPVIKNYSRDLGIIKDTTLM